MQIEPDLQMIGVGSLDAINISRAAPNLRASLSLSPQAGGAEADMTRALNLNSKKTSENSVMQNVASSATAGAGHKPPRRTKDSMAVQTHFLPTRAVKYIGTGGQSPMPSQETDPEPLPPDYWDPRRTELDDDEFRKKHAAWEERERERWRDVLREDRERRKSEAGPPFDDHSGLPSPETAEQAAEREKEKQALDANCDNIAYDLLSSTNAYPVYASFEVWAGDELDQIDKEIAFLEGQIAAMGVDALSAAADQEGLSPKEGIMKALHASGEGRRLEAAKAARAKLKKEYDELMGKVLEDLKAAICEYEAGAMLSDACKKRPCGGIWRCLPNGVHWCSIGDPIHPFWGPERPPIELRSPPFRPGSKIVGYAQYEVMFWGYCTCALDIA